MNGKPGENRPVPRPHCIITKPALPGQAPQMKCYPPQKPGPRNFIAAVVTGMAAPSVNVPSGGPGSGLWASGTVPPAPAPSPVPTPTPVPPPPVVCVTADILADCFAACTGTINSGSPGPICGWAWDFTQASGGSISFTPGVMSFNAPTGSEGPADKKAFTASLATVLGMTGQYTFTEWPSPLGNGFAGYEIAIASAGQADLFQLFLENDGDVFLQVGSFGNNSLYLGTWFPNNGTHKVHFTVDALGVPRLWIDGVEIPLTFSGMVFFNPTSADSVVFVPFEFSGFSDATTVSEVFVATRILPPETVFCCPP